MNGQILGMCHYGPLPGDPRYCGRPVAEVAEDMRRDVLALQSGGVDGIMFSNEHSQPWMLRNPQSTVCAMAAVLGQLRAEITVPFGVHVIWDAAGTLDLAEAVEADFAWEVYSGVYCSDYGLWDTQPSAYLREHRRRRQIPKLLCEIVPEAGAALGCRRIADIAKSVGHILNPYAICVAGLKPGIPPSTDLLAELKRCGLRTAATTGIGMANIREYAPLADICIVGSCFKQDGKLFNSVDGDRVARFMEEYRRQR